MIKIAKQFASQMPQPQEDDTSTAPATSLTIWFLKPITVGHTSMTIFINEATLAPIILPPLDMLAVPATSVLRNILATNLQAQFVNPEKLDKYFKECFDAQEAVDNISTNFSLERAYQEFVHQLQSEEMDLVNDQENQHLFQHLNVLMDKLVENTSFFKDDPFLVLGEMINQRIRIPAHAATSKGQDVCDLRAAYDQWADKQFLTKKDADFAEAKAAIQDLNEQLMSRYEEWLSHREKADMVTAALLTASKYLNSFLLENYPESIFNDLTAPSEFLTSWRTKNQNDPSVFDHQEVSNLTYLSYFLGETGYWSQEDATDFEMAAEGSTINPQTGFHQRPAQDSGQHSAASGEVGSDTLLVLFQELFRPEYSKLLDHLLSDLTKDQRQDLMERLQKIDH